MSEKRLIDANALSERLKDLDDWCRDLRKPGIEQARCIVHEAPTIPAEVVRHGRWVWKSGAFWCSECWWRRDGADWGMHIPEDAYCKKCGARMDGQGEGDANG